MLLKRLNVCAVFFFGISLTCLQAQEVILPTGSTASGSSGSIVYSVGQVFSQTYTGTSGTLIEGVQQPYEISAVTGLEDIEGISLNIFAYPNPTAYVLKLSVEDLELSKLTYGLYDMNGRLLQKEKIVDNETTIKTGNLVPSMYLMKVFHGNKELKTFKIIKN